MNQLQRVGSDKTLKDLGPLASVRLGLEQSPSGRRPTHWADRPLASWGRTVKSLPMTFDLALSIKVFTALFAIMNPIANVPIFLSLTEGASDAERRKIAVTALVAVSIGCIVSAVAGAPILGVFGVSIDDFRLAGGLLVLLIALSMVHGSASTQQAPTDQERKNLSDEDSVAIYPLAIPLMLGPGAIATMIVQGHGRVRRGQGTGLRAGAGGLPAAAGRVRCCRRPSSATTCRPG